MEGPEPRHIRRGIRPAGFSFAVRRNMGLPRNVASVAPKREYQPPSRGPGTPHNAAPLHRRGSSCLFLVQPVGAVLFASQPHPLLGRRAACLKTDSLIGHRNVASNTQEFSGAHERIFRAIEANKDGAALRTVTAGSRRSASLSYAGCNPSGSILPFPSSVESNSELNGALSMNNSSDNQNLGFTR
jgi:hypothetical protein